MICFDHLTISMIVLILLFIPIHFISIFDLFLDYICYNLQRKQIISLILSDETIPRQVKIFKQYFPFFKHQLVTFIEIFADKIDLPESVRFLEIKKYDIYKNFDFNYDQLLEQQAKVLTHLKLDRIGTLTYINTQFSVLTHLIIDGGFAPDVDYYVEGI